MVKDHKVVLVHHSYQDGWFMPGGAVKRGETLEQAAIRETAEETRVTLHNIKFIGTYTSFQEEKTDHISFFLSEDFTLPADLISNQSGWSRDYEVNQVKAFPLNDLPSNLADGHGRRIKEFLAAKFDGLAPTCGEW